MQGVYAVEEEEEEEAVELQWLLLKVIEEYD